jgi:hypothetical protein
MKNLVDFYGLLDVSYYATSDEIKEAYRKKVKETHPDNIQGDSEQFKLIIEAYEVLSNDEKRKRYDDVLFKATKFNVLTVVPKKEKENVLPKNEKNEKKEKKPISWIVTSCVALFAAFLLIGIVIYLNNQVQVVNDDNKILDSRLTGMLKENKEFVEDNRLLDSQLTGVIKENQDLIEKVDSLENEMLQQDYNNSTVQASSTSTTTPVTESNSGYVNLGSTEDEVKAILGTPERIQFTTWYYGYNASISFDYFDKTVNGWNNDSGKLKVK